MRQQILRLISLAALVVSSCSAHAATRIWNVESGSWTTAINWSPNSVPFTGDDAVITEKASDSSTLTVNYNQTPGMFAVTYNSVTLDNLDSTGGMAVLLQQANSFNTFGLSIGNHFASRYEIDGGSASISALTLFSHGQLAEGTFANVNVGNFNQQGGTLTTSEFVDRFNVSGTYTFSSGTVVGSVTNNGTMLYNSSGGSYQGSILNNGTLVVNSAEATGFVSNNGTLILNSALNCYVFDNEGTFTLPANRTINTDAAHYVEIGGNFTQLGNITTGDAITTGGTWDFKGGQLTSPQFSVGYTLPGTFIMDSSGSLTVGSGTTGSDLNVAGSGAGTFIQNTGAVHLVKNLDVGGPQGGLYVMNNGLLDAASSNITVAPASALSGTFTQAGGTVNCANLTINEDSASAGTYAMAGGTLNISDLIVNNGTFVQTGGSVLSFKTFGSGALVLSGTASFASSSIRQTSVSLGGTAQITGGITTGNSHRVQSLTFVPVSGAIKARWDIGFGPLIVDYSGASPIASLRTDLVSAYAGGAWSGPGLGTSFIGSGNTVQSLGYAEASMVLGANGGAFEGLQVDGTAVLIAIAYNGDTNLDGKVNISDLGALATHYGQSGGWSDGDFNYDGTINIADLGALATNYGAGASSPLPMSFQQALAEVEQQTGVQLPEPGMILSFIGVAATLCSRRRAVCFI